MQDYERNNYDVIIAGAGISGSFMAAALTAQGKQCLLIEAGNTFERHTYPRQEIDANSQLYWGGGIEFNQTATIGFLRPRVVGGGSVVNQALVDRFDDIALDSWRNATGIPYLTPEGLAPWYDEALTHITVQEIPATARNGNARIFEQGFAAMGYKCAPLKRAQSGCKYEEGNDCIECLAGCPLGSKQSMPETTLKKALNTGRLQLVPNTEVIGLEEDQSGVTVLIQTLGGLIRKVRSKKLVLASGAMGNTKILFLSGYGDKLPALGHGFYTHPQYMNLGVYNEPIHAEKAAFQAFKSDDPNFRQAGFKLENVFAPPVSLSVLLPGLGRAHQDLMKKITHFSCVEVAIRDTNPGRITVGKNGKIIVNKTLNHEDLNRKNKGIAAVENIFIATGSQQIIKGPLAVGLHLMGGCSIGTSKEKSVVGPDFKLHGFRRVYAAAPSLA